MFKYGSLHAIRTGMITYVVSKKDEPAATTRYVVNQCHGPTVDVVWPVQLIRLEHRSVYQSTIDASVNAARCHVAFRDDMSGGAIESTIGVSEILQHGAGNQGLDGRAVTAQV